MLPGMIAGHNAREKVISKATENRDFRDRYYCDNGEYRKCSSPEARAKIHVFCPPLPQYIYLALALASPDYGLETREFQVVIHPDDRLLDEAIYSVEEGYESLLQLSDFLHFSIGEPIDTSNLDEMRESGRQFLATHFDQVWMDQRITALASDKRTGEKIDASEFFRDSKEALEVALMVIMAGPQACDDITRTAPLACPSNPVQPSQIYTLKELADMDDNSLFRWKTTHFCRINWP